MQAPRALLDLQAVDLAIDRLSARKRALEGGEEVTAVRGEADAAERAYGELKLQIDAMDRDGAKFEHEIDSLSQKAAAEEKRMFDGSVANAKELESMRHEVENLRRRKSEREDELLALLEQREELDAQAKAALAEADEGRVRVEHAAGDAGEELGRIGVDLGVQAAERERLAATFDPEVLELYDDLRAHKKGVGAAALVDGVCQGCHETLSSVELDHVKHADDIQRCEHCRRILVL